MLLDAERARNNRNDIDSLSTRPHGSPARPESASPSRSASRPRKYRDELASPSRSTSRPRGPKASKPEEVHEKGIELEGCARTESSRDEATPTPKTETSLRTTTDAASLEFPIASLANLELATSIHWMLYWVDHATTKDGRENYTHLATLVCARHKSILNVIVGNAFSALAPKSRLVCCVADTPCLPSSSLTPFLNARLSTATHSC